MATSREYTNIVRTLISIAAIHSRGYHGLRVQVKERIPIHKDSELALVALKPFTSEKILLRAHMGSPKTTHQWKEDIKLTLIALRPSTAEKTRVTGGSSAFSPPPAPSPACLVPGASK